MCDKNHNYEELDEPFDLQMYPMKSSRQVNPTELVQFHLVSQGSKRLKTKIYLGIKLIPTFKNSS